MPTLGIRIATPATTPVQVNGRWYPNAAAAAKGPAPSPRRDAMKLRASRQVDVSGVLSFLKRV